MQPSAGTGAAGVQVHHLGAARESSCFSGAAPLFTVPTHGVRQWQLGPWARLGDILLTSVCCPPIPSRNALGLCRGR